MKCGLLTHIISLPEVVHVQSLVLKCHSKTDEIEDVHQLTIKNFKEKVTLVE